MFCPLCSCNSTISGVERKTQTNTELTQNRHAHTHIHTRAHTYSVMADNSDILHEC